LFMWKYLNQANIQQDSQKVRKVIDLLIELNRGWRAIAL
jgi:flagellin-specific chaperone FliS